MEKATYLLGQVEMCRTLIPNAELLTYSSLRREALSSSTIEGTIATSEELVLYQVTRRSEREVVKEVDNYAIALQWGCEELKRRPLSINFILGLHERLLDGVRGQHSAGRLKQTQNAIGSRPTDRIEDAVFIPASPEDTPELMYALERYLNLDNEEPQVVQCALSHYQFETIHPFSDGNGRVGRLLICHHLIQLGLLTVPLIYPSVYFERTRQEYYQRLQDVRDSGAWVEWIEYFANGIVVQCEESISFTKRILALEQRLQSEIGHIRKRAAVGAVLREFFKEPVLNVPSIVKQAGMAYNSVLSALGELEKLGYVYEMTKKQKGRVYACRPVLDIVFGRDGDRG